MTVPMYGTAAMQQVAQVARHVTIAVANARTSQNKQYKRISAGCAAINLVTTMNASDARQRCRYMIGTMKLPINDHAKTKRIIRSTHAAIADIRYTSCTRRKLASLIAGNTSGNESSPAKINRMNPTKSEKRK